MICNPEKHHRRSIRLKGYDYRQPGAYFITICTQDRACLFGEIMDGAMQLNDVGRIIWQEWLNTAVVRSYARVAEEEFVVMPNHIHGIIWIIDEVGARRRRAPTTEHLPILNDTDNGWIRQHPDPTLERFGQPVAGSIPTIIRAFKSITTKRINRLWDKPSPFLWQRNYYEHIVRNAESLDRIRQYILDNPVLWTQDRFHPGQPMSEHGVAVPPSHHRPQMPR